MNISTHILDRYDRMLGNDDYKPVRAETGSQTGGDHLRWMIAEIRGNSMPLTRQHRWLGFIQGILIARGYTTVQKERDFTRGLLAGT